MMALRSRKAWIDTISIIKQFLLLYRIIIIPISNRCHGYLLFVGALESCDFHSGYSFAAIGPHLHPDSVMDPQPVQYGVGSSLSSSGFEPQVRQTSGFSTQAEHGGLMWHEHP